jgi:hypothetical protein
MLGLYYHKLTTNLLLGGSCRLGTGDHMAIIMELERNIFMNPRKSLDTVPTRRFSANGFKSFNNLMNRVEWKFIYNRDEVKFFDVFFEHFIESFNAAFPLKNLKYRSKKKVSWYTEELKKTRDVMLWYRDLYRRTNDILYKEEYLQNKRVYNKALSENKRNSYLAFINNSHNKCRAVWSVINSETRGAGNRGNNETVFSADAFNDFFSADKSSNSTANNLNEAKAYLSTMKINGSCFCWSGVNEEDILEAIRHLSKSKCKDIYGMSNCFIKEIQACIVEPLTFAIQQILKSGHFPEALKICKVIPLRKKGSENNIQNYRPISIAPTISKIIEQIMCKQLGNYMESIGVVSKKQFGFRAGRSTEHALEYVVEGVVDAFERGNSVMMTMCDLSKAFDYIPIDLLLDKLLYYNIGKREALLISSFLSNRKQRTFANNVFSEIREINRGVPQGSILAPFLFNIFISDLPKSLPCDTVIYADDISLLNQHHDSNSLELLQEHSFMMAKEWFEANRLRLNVAKTEIMLFSLNSAEAKTVNFLGFYLESGLKWYSHSQAVCRKLARVLYAIRKLKPIVTLEVLRVVYFALFQSHINYGVQFWGNSPAAKEVFILQKRAVRTMLGKDNREHCRPLFKDLKVMTVYDMFIYKVLCYTKVNLPLYKQHNEVHHHNTRNKEKIVIPLSRLRFTDKFLKTEGKILFNKLPREAHDIPLLKFKNKIKKWMLEHNYYSVEEYKNDNLNTVFL